MPAYDTSRLYRFGRTWRPTEDDGASPEALPRDADAVRAPEEGQGAREDDVSTSGAS